MKIKRLVCFITGSINNVYRHLFVDWRHLGIKKGEIVVDLGSGGHPLLRADILVDKFLDGLAERPSNFLDSGAIVIQSDLVKLLSMQSIHGAKVYALKLRA